MNIQANRMQLLIQLGELYFEQRLLDDRLLEIDNEIHKLLIELKNTELMIEYTEFTNNEDLPKQNRNDDDD